MVPPMIAHPPTFDETLTDSPLAHLIYLTHDAAHSDGPLADQILPTGGRFRQAVIPPRQRMDDDESIPRDNGCVWRLKG